MKLQSMVRHATFRRHPRPTLRRALSHAAIAIAMGGTVLAAGAASAQTATPPAQQKTQVPGYYRMMIGQLEVTALYDGYIDLDPKLFKYTSAREVQSLLARMFVASTPGMQTAVNAYLIHTGSRLVLVDTGAAGCFGPTLGRIGENLRAAGYAPEQVDTVLLTHLHGDHACGLATDGKAAFPNATVYVDKADLDYWLSDANAAAAPKEAQGLFAMARAAIAPYQAAQRLRTFNGGAGSELVPGVRVVPANGHTPGHSGYLFTSGNDSLLLWGDIVHNHALQLRRPQVAIEFDVDSHQAVITRKRILEQAARGRLWVGGAHMPFPGLGHVRRDTAGYTWVPAEYGPIRNDR
ncbi:putative metallo-beta-lactamase; putative exported protein [Cupriavidus taiwanensis]|uniref:MBL fold metallo-hydrolase n=1 Tax=Cupriavidus taiwanensis TaxID=164546 RepID=UPI000E199D69|nr:MBL fold metallo-hydrolase [Cupriavidus taiwanensis]SOZ17606.1 putative metallo-beta-lactamase; putative exported protein [Cupriavidus taiwanensis]SOZ29975.1 putative metallo-beta-lactamase; putative exported protein [Cupriavidus taiwanensis]SOZ47026.1 putative metallo-beta-lactamase; putative exported protein [Cupriavidus taiwanensis]SPA00989.1 putative metallo-beta-lactamase; putative exported protein [Cupriavidus taiwanensis]SPA18915.1 putative metallo-beta-lactamase; putative exported p